jgi:hypothetical protein
VSLQTSDIGDTLLALVDQARQHLVGNPPAGDLPFALVSSAARSPRLSPRPALSIAARRTAILAGCDDDNLVAIALQLAIHADADETQTLDSRWPLVAAVNLFLESMQHDEQGQQVIGFDDRSWTLSESKVHSGDRIVSAHCEVTLIVRTGSE